MTYNPLLPDSVPPLEDAASLASLALAPWVESQARPLREAHIAERRSESDHSSIQKVRKWRMGHGRRGPVAAWGSRWTGAGPTITT